MKFGSMDEGKIIVIQLEKNKPKKDIVEAFNDYIQYIYINKFN